MSESEKNKIENPGPLAATADPVARESTATEGTSAPSGAADGYAEAPTVPQPTPAQVPGQPQQLKVRQSCSRTFPNWLKNARASIAITSYQSGLVYLVGSDAKGRVSFFQRAFTRAMGIVGNAQRLYLADLFQLWRFENILQKNQKINNQFDKCYVPRNGQTLGDLDVHELGIRADGSVVFVNTKYSCLAEPSGTHSFRAIWKPPFISKLAPEDRCHLNGLAMVDGKPKYVTITSKSDAVDGWRDRRENGGIVMDVETNEVVCEGLSMPHSPRWADGKLWLLNAGTGYLGWVDFEKKAFVPFSFVPGFARGLSIMGSVAAVGLSKPRYERFEGLALDEELKKRDAEPWCGVQIISLNNGDVMHWIRFDGDISELFDVSFLPGVRHPMIVGFRGPEITNLITFESSIRDDEVAANVDQTA